MTFDTHKHELAITLEQASTMSRLELTSAREVHDAEGLSYHDKEVASESASHRVAREKAMGFFLSRGYHVFPEGVGVRGVYTLADFVALRPDEGRLVFVEVLSDAGVTLTNALKKLQLQEFGELCLVVFSGGKQAYRQHEAEHLKRELSRHTDVLTINLNGYVGNHIEDGRYATVAYQTTRARGIQLTALRRATRAREIVDLSFVSRLYTNPIGVTITDCVGREAHFLETVFRGLFEELCKEFRARISYTRARRDVTAYRAMRRKSGLKAHSYDGLWFGSLKSDYRGPEVVSQSTWNYHPSSYDVPAEHLHGVFELSRNCAGAGDRLLAILRGHGFHIEEACPPKHTVKSIALEPVSPDSNR